MFEERISQRVSISQRDALPEFLSLFWLGQGARRFARRASLRADHREVPSRAHNSLGAGLVSCMVKN